MAITDAPKQLVDKAEEKFQQLLGKFNSLEKRQKINLGVIVLVGIMLIISIFFFFNAFKKVTVDRTAIEALQEERKLLQKEREALHKDLAEIKNNIAQENIVDSLMSIQINRQLNSLISIDSKIKSLNNAYKKPADYKNLSSDSLSKFFSDLDK